MSDNPSLADDLALVTERSQIPVPNPHPYSHITLAMVAWNEEERLEPLIQHLRGWFETIAIAVQESSDRTLAIASEYADILVTDEHRGYGDASFGPKLLPNVRTPWTFKVDCDEWPDEDVLSTLSSATWYAEQNGFKGVWIPFRSWVDGIEYEEQHSHLRLFETNLGWPGTLHSRPMTNDSCLWPVGHIGHARSLDEMMQDYLRYYRVGRGNGAWDAHNRLMMYWACLGTANVKGWDYVRSHTWWPEVEEISFAEEHPWDS